MKLFSRRPALRWLVPLVAVALLTTAGTALGALTASARESLPPRTAAQLLVDVQQARLEGLSGTIVQTADLGLPAVPGARGGDSSEFSSLVSGSHTMRLWYGGPDKLRLALLGQFGESDLIRNGADVWAWSSRSNTAQHLTVPDRAQAPGDGTATPADPGSAESLTPQQAAQRALDAITPTTAVRTDRTAVVAGRSAYQLVLEPKDDTTLVGTVRIAVDGATHIPTRVQVFARGAATPSFQVGFTSFDPTAPADSVFGFNPPPGATVKEGALGGWLAHAPSAKGESPSSKQPARPTVVGDGWSSVVVAALPASPDDPASTDGSSPLGGLAAVVNSLPSVSGGWGSGHVLRGSLFSALVTDDGRVAIGAVPPEQLYRALGRE